MDLEWRRGRVGDDRPVDVASREPQRPSRRLTDASSSISSPSGASLTTTQSTTSQRPSSGRCDGGSTQQRMSSRSTGASTGTAIAECPVCPSRDRDAPELPQSGAVPR
jgi:hypothetical protein